MHARFLTRLALGANVYGTGGILPDENRSKTGLMAVPAEPSNLDSHLFAYGLGDRRAVQDSGGHRAKSVARVSRITTTLIWPGYCSSFSIFRAIDSESCAAAPSSIRSGVTTTRISRPACITLLFSTPAKPFAISSSRVRRFT